MKALSDQVVFDTNSIGLFYKEDDVKQFVQDLFNKRRKEKENKYGQEVIDVEDLFELVGERLK